MRSHLTMLRLLLTASFLIAGTAHAESTFTERTAIAKQLVMMDSPRDALVNTSHNVKEHPMYGVVMERLDFNTINKEAAELMAANFNVEELNALMDFYQKPAGRSAAQKMSTYKKAIGIVVHDQMMAIIQDEMRKQQGAATGGVGFGGGIRR